MVEFLEVKGDSATIAVVKGKERVEVVKPGTQGYPADGAIDVQETELSPARARRVAELLFFAADYLEGLAVGGDIDPSDGPTPSLERRTLIPRGSLALASYNVPRPNLRSPD